MNIPSNFSPKALVFDYGGTLDTGGCHWLPMMLRAYQRRQLGVGEDDFRKAYVQVERLLGSQPLIGPHFTFRQTLHTKLRLQFEQLRTLGTELPAAMADQLTADLYASAARHTRHSATVLRALQEQGNTLALVSNFYGNLTTVLQEFGLRDYFQCVVESAAVGIRKPDPAIFSLALSRLGLQPEEALVVGDSLKNDLEPAHSLGCHVVRLVEPSLSASEYGPFPVITDLDEIPGYEVRGARYGNKIENRK